MKLNKTFLTIAAFILCIAASNTTKAQTWNIGTPNETDVTATLSGTGNNRTLTISGSGKMKGYYYTSIPWYSHRTSISKVIIDDNVTSIGESAFSGCTSLTSVIISNSVTSIEFAAFSGCTGLTSITIPNSVTSIGNNAFTDCTNLTSVTIPNSVTFMGGNVFGGTKWYNNQPDGLIYINTILYCYKGIMPPNTIIEVMDGTTQIADYAFYCCSELISITIPNSVTTIGELTFPKGNGLKHISVNWNTPLSVTLYNLDVSNITLSIPDGTSALYRADKFWQKFNMILEKSEYPCALPLAGGSINSDSITWVICDTVLLINGNGAIPNYLPNNSPWHTYSSSIRNVIIEGNVSLIGDCAFTGFINLTSITIPNSVTAIGNYAFFRCSNLASITIPNSVTAIKESAFSGCSGLTSITIPNSVTYIGNSAFSGCSNLTSITIPNSVTGIEYATFANCSSLTSITIPNSVTYIGSSAFSGCSNLTSITIPNSVTVIGYQAFHNTNWYNNQPDGLIYINTILYCYKGTMPPNTIVEVIEGTTQILGNAFYGCHNLTSITIPNSVTSIEKDAFSQCSGIKDVYVNWNTPLYLNTNNSPFNQKHGETTLHVPDGTAALYRASNVWREFNIPLESSECPCATPLASGSINSNSIIWVICDSTLTISGYGALPSGGTLHAYRSSIRNVILKDGISTIEGYAFSNWSDLISIDIGAVNSIGNYAFSGCSNLASIDIGKVNSIGNYVFNNCTKLSSVTLQSVYEQIIPRYEGDREEEQIIVGYDTVMVTKGVTSMGDYVFFGCTNLSTITIPKAMTYSVKTTTFDNSSLTSILVDNDNLYYASKDGILYNKAETSLIKCPPKKENANSIPNSVTSIGDNAFRNCSNLTSVTIPNNVTSIGNNAFQGCNNLQTVNYNATNCTTMGNTSTSVFQGCSSFTTLNICNEVTNIPNYAFNGCNRLDTLIIPNNITTIGTSAFYNCTGLKSLTIANGVATIGNYAFENCTGLTSLSIPNSITSIGWSAFAGCTNIEELVTPRHFSSIENLFSSKLKKLTFKTECTDIPAGALSKCTNLTELTLPFIGTSASPSEENATLGVLFGTSSNSDMQAVVQFYNATKSKTYYMPKTLKKLTITRPATQIAYGALYGCNMLEELTIASTVRGVGEKALYGCNSLEHIYSQWANPPAAYNNSTFEGVNKYACILHVPVGSKNKYAGADGWKEFYIDNIQEEAAVAITARPLPLYGGIIDGVLQYNYDETAKLTATGNMGYDFQGWMEDEAMVSTNREYSFTVEQPRTLYAVFTPRENENSIEITAHPTEAVIVWEGETGAGSYTLIIYMDADRTQEYARFEFDASGKIKSSYSHTVEGLTPEQQYFYTMTSYNSDNYKLNIAIGSFETTEEISIDNHPTRGAITLYPNPTSGELRIESGEFGEWRMENGEWRIASVEVFDIMGRKQYAEIREMDGGALLNIAHLPNGIYLVKAGGSVWKVVKN